MISSSREFLRFFRSAVSLVFFQSKFQTHLCKISGFHVSTKYDPEFLLNKISEIIKFRNITDSVKPWDSLKPSTQRVHMNVFSKTSAFFWWAKERNNLFSTIAKSSAVSSNNRDFKIIENLKNKNKNFVKPNLFHC